MTDFKVGDRVKVEFEGVVVEKREDNPLMQYLNFQCVEDQYGNKHTFTIAHLALIERAKPKLEVGQVWKCEKRRGRKILAFHDYEVAYSLEGCTGIHVQDEESFIEDLAHELISEGENG